MTVLFGSLKKEENPMQHRGQYYVGVLLICLGLIFLIARVFGVNPWSILWPLLLIGLGVWLLVRRKYIPPGTSVSHMFLGDIRREGAWSVSNEEYRIFIGDVELDMTRAKIPAGETTIRVFGFISDINVHLPKSAGISISSSGFITEVKADDRKQEAFFGTAHFTSDNYETARQKIRLETTFFIHEVNVKQGSS